MKQATAETIAEMLGQPVEVYTDDSREAERLAYVKEVAEIDYPLDMSAIGRELQGSGKKYMFITDCAQCHHLFVNNGGRVDEVTRTGSRDADTRNELMRIASVYRQNCRMDHESRTTDYLKGLLLLSRGLIPETKAKAEKELARIFRKYKGMDDLSEIGSWDPVLFAMRSIRDLCPGATPGQLGSTFISSFASSYSGIGGTDRVAAVAASFVETPSVTMPFFNPFIASLLPQGSVTRATHGFTYDLDIPFCELLGVKEYDPYSYLSGLDHMPQGSCDDPHDYRPGETVVTFPPVGYKGFNEAKFIRDVLMAMPEGTRLIAVAVPGIMYNTRAAVLWENIKDLGCLRASVTVNRGISVDSALDAVVLVIDRTPKVEPTEFATVPDILDTSGNWREWPGVKFGVVREFGYGTFDPVCRSIRVSDPDVFCIGSVAKVRKGGMVRSGDLFPTGVKTGIPYLTPRDLTDQGFNPSNLRRAPATVTVVAKTNDILMVCTGDVGKVHRMTDVDHVVAPSYAFAIITVTDTDRYSPEFLELYLRSEEFTGQIEDLMDGHRLRSISTDRIRKIEIPDIPIERQLNAVDTYRDELYAGEDPDIDGIIYDAQRDD